MAQPQHSVTWEEMQQAFADNNASLIEYLRIAQDGIAAKAGRAAVTEIRKAYDPRFIWLEERVGRIEEYLATVDQRLAALEKRLTALEKRQIAMEQRLTALEKHAVSVDQYLVAMEQRQIGMEQQQTQILHLLTAIAKTLNIQDI